MNQPRDSLILVYGLACPLRCDFCCHAQDELGSARMPLEPALDWLRQAAALPVTNLVITGGEPFLYPADLAELVGQATELGLPTRIVTAAHWALSPERARDVLAPLSERGLKELSVSTDPSHQAFVPAAFAENAATAARALGIDVELAGTFWDPDTRVEDICRVPPGAKTTRGLAIPFRAGGRPGITPAFYRLGPERFLACGQADAFDLTVYPDGGVYPCCAGGFNIRGRLRFGDLTQEPLAAIAARIHADRYLRVVMGAGFGLLYELAGLRWPDVAASLPARDAILSPCELCARLHADPEMCARLGPILCYALQVWAAVRDLRAGPHRRPEVPRA